MEATGDESEMPWGHDVVRGKGNQAFRERDICRFALRQPSMLAAELHGVKRADVGAAAAQIR